MGAPVNPANRPQRGTPLTFALDQIAAAMAPRPGGRGGLPAPVAVEDFEIAAMGPRPEGRGGAGVAGVEIRGQTGRNGAAA